MGDAPTRVEPRSDSELAAAALSFARRVHLGQHRKQTHEQFVEHPIAVARLLVDTGYGDEVIVAAYLHDVVEKTKIELPEIRERFGPEVADVVESLSEDEGIAGYAERKRALRRRVLAAGGIATLIYAADRVANMRDWHRIPPPEREAIAARLDTTLEERLDLWREDLAELTRADPELPFLTEIELELRELQAETPSAAA